MKTINKRLPTFKFRETKKGIIFATYPIKNEFLDGDGNLIHSLKSYKDGMTKGIWHPNIEFIFFPVNSPSIAIRLIFKSRSSKSFFENYYQDYGLPGSRTYPISKGELMENNSYFPDLAGAKIYWGEIMTDIEFDESVEELKKNILFPYKIWMEEKGLDNISNYYESLIDKMDICDEYLTKKVRYEGDCLSFDLLNYILGIDFVKLKIVNLELIELYFLNVYKIYADKTGINTHDYSLVTNRIYELRFTNEFPKELITHILKNRITQIRPDGVKWKDNNEIENDEGDSDFCYYSVEDIKPILIDKYFSKPDSSMFGYLTMFKKSEIFLNNISVVMTEYEIDQESKNDKDFFSNDNPNAWMENPEDYWNID